VSRAHTARETGSGCNNTQPALRPHMRERANTGNSWKTGITLSVLLCKEI
jgi:hypothetical protein